MRQFLMRLRAGLLGGAAVLVCSVVQAAPLPTEPQLLLSVGMHTAMLKSAAADRAGKFFVTVSDDKTARVWDARTGKPGVVLRPPVGAGTEGQLNAVAISPDGDKVAVAGDTTAGESNRTIYIFDRANGKIVARVKGVPAEVNKLAWSHGGKYLAALLKEGGLRVYRTRDWGQAGFDREYKLEGNDLAFSREDRLATTAMDGQIRLYSVADSAILKIKSIKGNGAEPFGVSFHPDGRSIAVTYVDAPRVEVRSSADLNEIMAPSVQGLPKNSGGFVAIAWSADGNSLYAAGQPRKGDQHIVRGWLESGTGQFADLPVSKQVVMALVTLPNGDVIYAAADPAWGRIRADGTVIEQGASQIADVRPAGKFETFGVAADGRAVTFGFDGMAVSPASFDVDSRLMKSGRSMVEVFGPRLSAQGWELANWRNQESPVLNGKKIGLRAMETSRSFAIAHDAKGLVLGADFSLRRFDDKATQVWEVATPGIAWAVNVTRDGRFAVVAYGDGTIRWHRYSDGKETLALFPHRDKKRWVMWTPSGYFDASPGGDDLFGWHLNRGKDAAGDFFPASRFRDRFFHPELIARIFATADENTAIKQQAAEEKKPEAPPVKVDQVLPPLVEILSPAEGSAVSDKTVKVKLKIRSEAPITEVRARINGQAAAATLTGQGDSREVTLTIPERDVEIMFFASNKNATSSPAVLRLQWKGAPPTVAKAAVKPKLYLLSIGVSDYVDSKLKLDLAAKDASDFAQSMRQQNGVMYREIEERVLLDREATRNNVVKGLEWLTQKVTNDDVAVVFMAGHGMNEARAGYYFIPADYDSARFQQTGVKSSDIVDTLSRLPGRVVAFFDTCHSGNVLAGGKSGAFKRDTTKMVNDLSSPEHGVVVFTSATGAQVALESPAWGNGAFTKALVEGLLGQAADAKSNNRIMHRSLESFVGQKVGELTQNRQTPTTISPQGVQNFPLAIKR